MVALAAAMLFLAVAYLPELLLWNINSDYLIPAIFYQDLAHGGHAHDWGWGGASFIFPDLTLSFLFTYLLGNGVAGLEVVTAFFFLSWIVLAVMVYAASGFRNCEVFAVFVVLLGAVMLPFWSFPLGFAGAFFFPVDHGGGYLLAMAVLAGVQQLWLRGWKSPLGLVLVGVLTLAATASDGLTVPVLVGPLVVAMLLAAIFFSAGRRRALVLAGTIGGSALAGFFLPGAVFPPHMATGTYTGFDLGRMLNSLSLLGQDLDFAHRAPISCLFILDGVLFLAAVWVFCRSWGGRDSTSLSPACFFLVTYTAGLLAMNWAAVVMTGCYTGVDTNRYVALSLFWPLFLLAGWLSASINWRPNARRVFALAVSGICAVIALHPPDPAEYRARKLAVSELEALFKQENTTAALGNYWYANIMTVLSKGVTPVREVSDDGMKSHWFADTEWYSSGPPGGFRVVLVPGSNPTMLKAHFGAPQRVTAVAGMETWIYAPENAIHFIPVFRTIGNRHSFPTPDAYHISAPGIPRQTGVIEEGSIVARPERDVNGTIADGPNIRPLPGRYRVEFTYAYLAPPEKGREPIFDAVLVNNYHAVVSTSEPLPQSGSGTQSAAQEFAIPVDVPGQLQCRIQYRSSGIIRVDSQTITRLGS